MNLTNAVIPPWVRLVISLVAVIALAGGGFWAGVQWQVGRDAIADQAIDQATIQRLHGELVNVVSDVRTQAIRLDTIAGSFETDRATTERAYEHLRTKFDRYFASHPDLADCGLDADGLQLWNDANAGAAAAADAAAADPRQPQTAVHDGVTGDAGRSQVAGDESRHGDAAGDRVSPTPRTSR